MRFIIQIVRTEKIINMARLKLAAYLAALLSVGGVYGGEDGALVDDEELLRGATADTATVFTLDAVEAEEVEAATSLRGVVGGAGTTSSYAPITDCAFIGMGENNCDPTLAKVIAHTQFPRRCTDIAPIPTQQTCMTALEIAKRTKAGWPPFYETWANNGFGSDATTFFPQAIVAGIRNAAPAVFLVPRAPSVLAKFWSFNVKSISTDFCPTRSYGECYFKPISGCVVDPKCPASIIDSLRTKQCQPQQLNSFVAEASATSAISKTLGAAKDCGIVRGASAALLRRGWDSRPPTKAEVTQVYGMLGEEAALDEPTFLLQLHTAALAFRPNSDLHAFLAKRGGEIGFTRRRIGVQVRHSDFIIEHAETRVEAYCIVVAQMMKQTGVYAIFLATDDPDITAKGFATCVVDAAHRKLGWTSLRRKHVHVASQAWKPPGAGETFEQAKKVGMNKFALIALADIMFMSRCDAGLVISARSGFSHLAMMLSVANGKAQHYAQVDCAGAVQPGGGHHPTVLKDLDTSTGRVEGLPLFVNRFVPPPGVNVCERGVKRVVFTHQNCAAPDVAASFAAHVKSPLQLRIPFGPDHYKDGGHPSCVGGILTYTEAKNQCMTMCDQKVRNSEHKNCRIIFYYPFLCLLS